MSTSKDSVLMRRPSGDIICRLSLEEFLLVAEALKRVRLGYMNDHKERALIDAVHFFQKIAVEFHNEAERQKPTNWDLN